MPESAVALSLKAGEIYYPESDGQPMSDNTRQFRWITTLAGNIAALFRDREHVFVCGNQNWYPVEGETEIRAAPDVYAVFGRPKKERGSYKQWEEDGVPLTVVFEVLSPGNSVTEMQDKHAFYEEYGAEEYYIYDPENNRLHGFVRRGEVLIRVRRMHGYVSPRLGISFDLAGPELVVRYPDGRPFLTFEDLAAERDQSDREVERERQRAEQERQRAEQERQRAEQERQRAEQAELEKVRLAVLTRKVVRKEATSEETLELEEILRKIAPANG